MKSELPGPVPEIPVRDIATAAAYYQAIVRAIAEEEADIVRHFHQVTDRPG
jgi:hypothetical protein